MNEKPSHLTGYLTYAVIVVVLFLLTALSVFSTGYHLGALTVGLALLIAAVKVAIVLTYYMHLRSEGLFLKLAVAGVFVLYGLIVIITFFDYLFR
jgi:cytochrome c oxidase subunit 4